MSDSESTLSVPGNEVEQHGAVSTNSTASLTRRTRKVQARSNSRRRSRDSRDVRTNGAPGRVGSLERGCQEVILRATQARKLLAKVRCQWRCVFMLSIVLHSSELFKLKIPT